MKWKTAALAGTVIIIALVLYLGLREHGTAPATTPVPRYISAEGKLEARPGAKMEIGSAVAARIEQLLVKDGEHVEQGQVVAILAAEDFSARLRQAEAELAVAQAKRVEVAAGARDQEIKQAQAELQQALSERTLAEAELARMTRLYQDKFISRAKLDNTESAYKVAAARAEKANEQLQLLRAGPRRETLAWLAAKVTQAEARVRYARALLDKTRVTAPISGTLIERYLDVGEVVIPEKPIALIADTSQLRVNAEVDETDAGRLRLGDPVEIRAYAYPGRVYQGRVEEIARYVGKREIKPNNPAVNLGLKIIQVKIALLETTPLELGMTVDVRIMPTGKDKRAG